MEEKAREKELGVKDTVSRVEWVESNSKIYAYINKKTEENKDKIEENKDKIEYVDDKHTERYNEMLRRQDRHDYQIETFSNSVVDLKESIIKLTDFFTRQESEISNVKVTLNDTRGSMLTKTDIEASRKAEEEKKKAEIYKLLSIVIPALIGAGGLLSWLGPLFF